MKNHFNDHARAKLFNAETILDVKYTRLRIYLSGLMDNANSGFSDQDFENVISAIRNLSPNKKIFEAEVKNVRSAVLHGRADTEPNLNSPDVQLAWAAALLLINKNLSEYDELWNRKPPGMTHNPDAPGKITEIGNAPLWEQLTTSRMAVSELTNHARFINEDIRRNDVRFAYGKPGSGFKYERDSNEINVDLLGSLIAGFEHTRGILFREIANSLLSRKYTDTSNALREDIREIKSKYDYSTGAQNFMGQPVQRNMPVEDYIKLRKLSAEWQMRNMLWQSSEHNMHHRYTSDKGKKLAQDYAYSLNHDLLTVGGYGETALRTRHLKRMIEGSPVQVLRDNVDLILSNLGEIFGKPDEDKPYLQERRELARKRFVNTIRAVEMAFYRDNDLFKDKSSGWLSVGVDPKLIKMMETPKDLDDYRDNKTDQHPEYSEDFEYLIDLCLGEQGLESLQPQPEDRLFGYRHYKNRAEELNDQRNQIIEKIWDTYLSEDAEVLLEEMEEKLWKDLGYDPPESKFSQPPQDSQNNAQPQNPKQGQQQDPGQQASQDPSQQAQQDPSQDPQSGAEQPDQAQSDPQQNSSSEQEKAQQQDQSASEQSGAGETPEDDVSQDSDTNQQPALNSDQDDDENSQQTQGQDQNTPQAKPDDQAAQQPSDPESNTGQPDNPQGNRDQQAPSDDDRDSNISPDQDKELRQDDPRSDGSEQPQSDPNQSRNQQDQTDQSAQPDSEPDDVASEQQEAQGQDDQNADSDPQATPSETDMDQDGDVSDALQDLKDALESQDQERMKDALQELQDKLDQNSDGQESDPQNGDPEQSDQAQQDGEPQDGQDDNKQQMQDALDQIKDALDQMDDQQMQDMMDDLQDQQDQMDSGDQSQDAQDSDPQNGDPQQPDPSQQGSDQQNGDQQDSSQDGQDQMQEALDQIKDALDQMDDQQMQDMMNDLQDQKDQDPSQQQSDDQQSGDPQDSPQDGQDRMQDALDEIKDALDQMDEQQMQDMMNDLQDQMDQDSPQQGDQNSDPQSGDQQDNGQPDMQDLKDQLQDALDQMDDQQLKDMFNDLADEQDQDQTPGNDFDPSQTGVNEDEPELDVQNQQGQGQEMPNVDLPPENPESMPDPQEGQEPMQDMEGQPQDPGQDGMTLEQLEQMMKMMQDQGQDGQPMDGMEGQPQPGQPGQDGQPQDDSMPSDQAGEQDGKSLEDIAKMDWQDFPKIVQALQGHIHQVARLLRKIREQQIEKHTRRSDDLELFPDGKEMDRLDMDAHKDFITKVKTGQPIEERDLHRFQMNEQYDQPAEMDLVLLIDGSGSMDSGGYRDDATRGATPMEIALLTATIISEAARSSGVDARVTIAIWGDSEPKIIAEPGDDPHKVGKNIAAFRKGTSSGTILDPSIKKLAELKGAETPDGQIYVGYTHAFIITDGDIGDPDKAKKTIETLLNETDYLTIDAAVIKDTSSGYSTNKIMEMFQEIEKKYPAKKIGSIAGLSVDELPAAVIGSLFEKIRKNESFRAIPFNQKRKGFKKAHRRMQP